MIVPEGITWVDANNLAEQNGGHLATITSQNENDFVFSLINDGQYWNGSGGTGRQNDPYQIATADDLMLLSESPGDYKKHFILTAEMQTASTFLEAGWDFADETANGTEDIWWILEDQGYPRLWWEAID